MSTPYMNLTLPTVSVTTGPTYATNINSDLSLLDSHNHSPGYGALVPTSGLNINADLSMGGYNLSSLAQAKFTTTSTALTVARSLGFVSSELWARDGSGNNVQITSSGQLNTGTFTQIATPSSPASGYNKLYPKTDNKFYILTSGGIESQLLTGASTQTVNSLTSNTTLTSSYSVVLCSASGGAFTVTLPSVSVNPGQIYKIKKTDSTFANAVTIARTGGDVFQDGGATVTSTTLNTQGEEIEVISDGSSTWQILNRRIPSILISYSLTIGATTSAPTQGSGATNEAYWCRIGDKIRILFSYIQSNAGAAGTGVYTFPPPSGITFDTAKITVSTNVSNGIVGTASGFHTTDTSGYVKVRTSTALQICLGDAGTNPTPVSDSYLHLGNADQRYSFEAIVPVSGWNG